MDSLAKPSSHLTMDLCGTVALVSGTTLTKQLGRRLKFARLQKELTQKEAALLAGVSRERWGQMERGSVANLNKLAAACEAIGVVLTVDVVVPQQ